MCSCPEVKLRAQSVATVRIAGLRTAANELECFNSSCPADTGFALLTAAQNLHLTVVILLKKMGWGVLPYNRIEVLQTRGATQRGRHAKNEFYGK